MTLAQQQLVQLHCDICRLRADLADLQRRLADANQKQRDRWDKLNIVQPLLAGVLVAAIGAAATYTYNQRQLDLNARRTDASAIQTVEKFFPHLVSDRNQPERRAAILAIRAMGQGQLAADLGETFGGSGGESALNVLALDIDVNVRQRATEALNRMTASAVEHAVRYPESGRSPGVIGLHRNAGPVHARVFIGDALYGRYRLLVSNATHTDWTLKGEGTSADDHPDEVDLGSAEDLENRWLRADVQISLLKPEAGQYSATLSVWQGSQPTQDDTRPLSGVTTSGTAVIVDQAKFTLQ